jgi:hypothetical protein
MCLSDALRQCKSLSGCQRYFSLKKLKQRCASQCVKPITQAWRQSLDYVSWIYRSRNPFGVVKSFIAQIPSFI